MELKVTAEHPNLEHLDQWLSVEERIVPGSPFFRHLFMERTTERLSREAKDELFTYIDHAHEGARRVLRVPLGTSLHPVHYGTEIDPAYGYPHRFPISAKRGFFGELLSGIVAEYWLGHDEISWEVPAFLFRHHTVAFQQLELMKQIDDWDRQMLGRTGDDGLAFLRSSDDRQILGWLACEAKCTGKHSATMITENHRKLSTAARRPIDLLRLIDALGDYDHDDYHDSWVDALRRFYFATPRNGQNLRRDLSVYVCARSPKHKQTWTSTDGHHSEYTGGRDFYCVELQMTDVDSLIDELYGRMESTR